jgi:hypothetical protein
MKLTQVIQILPLTSSVKSGMAQVHKTIGMKWWSLLGTNYLSPQIERHPIRFTLGPTFNYELIDKNRDICKINFWKNLSFLFFRLSALIFLNYCPLSFYIIFVEHWFSKCGPWPAAIRVAWKLRHLLLRLHSRCTEPDCLGWSLAPCILTSFW